MKKNNTAIKHTLVLGGILFMAGHSILFYTTWLWAFFSPGYRCVIVHYIADNYPYWFICDTAGIQMVSTICGVI